MRLPRSTAGKARQHRASLCTCTQQLRISQIRELCASCEQLRPTTVVRQQIHCSHDAAELNLSLR